jgi:chromosome segregation ATPase
MAETKKPIGKEIMTAHDQLIDFIRLCNAVKTKEGVLGKQTEAEDGHMMFNESEEVKKAETKLIGIDSDVVEAIKFIYGRPNISHIDIPNLDLNEEKDSSVFAKLNGILKEDKLNEAIKLVEEAMADKENFLGEPDVAISGMKYAKEVMDDFRPLQNTYTAIDEEAKRNKSIENLERKRAYLDESREARMQDVENYDRQLAKIDADIKKLVGETKKEVGRVVSLEDERAKRKPAEVIPIAGEAEVYDFEPEIRSFIDSIHDVETKKTVMNLVQSAITELSKDKLKTFIDTLKKLIGGQPPTPPPIAERALRPPKEDGMVA